MHENMQYGRYCKSGMAFIQEDENKMTCVEISQVKTNIDGYSSAQEAPFECRIHNGDGEVDDDFETACQYQYVDANGNQQLLRSEYCECSLMEEKEPEEP